MRKINFFIFILFSYLLSIISNEPVSRNRIELINNSFQNLILKNYETALELRTNGTVSGYNILYKIKLFAIKLDKSRIERIIEKLNDPKLNNTKNDKYVDDYYENEKSFLKAYEHLLLIVHDTNNLYKTIIQTIKKIFFITIGIIILGGIIALIVMYYISKTKYKDYSVLVDKNDKKEDKGGYQIVKIFNNFLNINKKLKWLLIYIYISIFN